MVASKALMYVKLIPFDGSEFNVKREHTLTSGTVKAMLRGAFFLLSLSFLTKVQWCAVLNYKILAVPKKPFTNTDIHNNKKNYSIDWPNPFTGQMAPIPLLLAELKKVLNGVISWHIIKMIFEDRMLIDFWKICVLVFMKYSQYWKITVPHTNWSV